MEVYKRWIRRNKDFVRQLDSIANNLTWFLPDEFAESEIGPEAVSSLVGMISTVNEYIIETSPTEVHTRCAESSFIPLSLCLTLLKDLETSIEVVAEQIYGEKNKWNLIAITEAVKVCIRLVIFGKTGYKMLLEGGETENGENDSDSFSLQKTKRQLGKPTGNEESGITKTLHAQNSGNLEDRAISALSNFGKKAAMQHPQAIMEPPSKLAERPSLWTFLSEKGVPGGFFVTGEILFIIRPLVYVLLMRKYGTRSWFPWCVSLAVDLIGNSILSVTLMSQHSGKNQQLQFSDSEKDELKRRRMLWALYLMRDPLFTKYTRQRLESTQRLVQPIPILGFVAEKIIEILIGVQTRYTYISGS
ncbi:peroxisome biogenesis protein 16-like isoform X1 [Solanum tuberosum]|uniref:peroxisome biogenesis protein 16-like isoform X1 n=2 Tax=Solanum tuberosum TaxID=4113 RepID=UPI0003D27582|nr:PREDICTED: peroxisome biogenesis protein 16-like isoform X1 [Solanum tuberosum]XP_015164205.1 PREDICTED: peroxisome biogenesis protein 16-like isoform X1 [Solanum tuberosum]